MADRFHLMQNLRLAVEEQMSLSGRATARALLPDEKIGLIITIESRMENSLKRQGAISFAGHIGSPGRMSSRQYTP
ncbi:hypothetical protein AJ87_00805 [Rhizobium yanglingense]|nr:hypothetical protein AJ87_00805 [Rhizobium yanglingense]